VHRLPLFAEGTLSPADDVLDIGVAAVLVRLLGWQWELLPAFAAELVPGVDLVPFWTLAVINVYRKWKQIKEASVEQGISGEGPGAPAPYVAMGHLLFDSVEAFQTSFVQANSEKSTGYVRPRFLLTPGKHERGRGHAAARRHGNRGVHIRWTAIRNRSLAWNKGKAIDRVVSRAESGSGRRLIPA